MNLKLEIIVINESSSVIFRLFSLLGMLALAGVLWLKWDTLKNQSHSFPDETVDNAYTILQSSKEAQWKDVSTKTVVTDVFEANEQIDQGAENPLEQAISALRT